jgi:ElaB/YqjD/DUF883 family membrane-anchored ribosome-binding protein
MAKGYDPDKYVNDLTKSAAGLDDLLKKNADKIESAKKVQETKDKAAAVAKDKVTALEDEQKRLEQNRKQVARLIATAKGEPLPEEDEPQDVTDFETEPATV